MASSKSNSRRSHTRSASAELIACNGDLLMQIFLRLPAKTVLRLRIINKQWHYLISSPEFRRMHCRHNFNFSPSGLYFKAFRNLRYSKSITFDAKGHCVPRSSSIFPSKHGKQILESCNGIFLYYSGSFRDDPSTASTFYVSNPTTKQSTLLPSPEGIKTKQCVALSLAFDPSLSPHYKVVYLWWCEVSRELYSQVYSSETHHWDPSNHVAFASGDRCRRFIRGLYCNGAIQWIIWENDLVYYKVSEDCLQTTKLPSRHYEVERSMCEETAVEAIQNNLIFIDKISYNRGELIVFELNKDYLGFVKKYHIADSEVLSPFAHLNGFRSYILGAFQGVEKEDIVVIIELSGGIVIAHHTRDKSTQVLVKLRGAKLERWQTFVCHAVYNYIESLCPV